MGCGSSVKVQPERETFSKYYLLGEKIGQGAFGQVCLAYRRDFDGDRQADQEMQGKESVVKILVMQRPDSSEPAKAKQHLWNAALKEAHIWRKIGKHKYVVELFESFQEKDVFFLVMEKCESDLSWKLFEMNNATDVDLAKIFREMLRAIAHLHSRNVVHRDVKPENFLIGGAQKQTVKISDFGLAAEMPACGYLTGYHGTAPYMSPEMASGGCYNERTDVWSFAVTCYMIIFAQYPYGKDAKTGAAMRAAIAKGDPHPKFSHCPLGGLVAAFVKSLWSRDPAARHSATEALALDFVKPNASETPSCDFVSLERAANAVRKATLEFKTKVDNGIQRNMDETLKQLRREYNAKEMPQFPGGPGQSSTAERLDALHGRGTQLSTALENSKAEEEDSESSEEGLSEVTPDEESTPDEGSADGDTASTDAVDTRTPPTPRKEDHRYQSA